MVEVDGEKLIKQAFSEIAPSTTDNPVNNDVIHLVEVGVDPDVLINNKTYPIDVQALEDKDIAIKLDKFQTKATTITDDRCV